MASFLYTIKNTLCGFSIDMNHNICSHIPRNSSSRETFVTSCGSGSAEQDEKSAVMLFTYPALFGRISHTIRNIHTKQHFRHSAAYFCRCESLSFTCAIICVYFSSFALSSATLLSGALLINLSLPSIP